MNAPESPLDCQDCDDLLLQEQWTLELVGWAQTS